MDTKSQLDIERTLKILNYALGHQNMFKDLLSFNIGRAKFVVEKQLF